MRKRMTWNDSGVRQRRASEHPATPDEGPASPAYGGPDPAADAYENGDTSSWAEDPHPGPYTNSEHPAYPDEGPASPAYKAAALERKAAKCIRLATAMLGEGATVAAIEDQALALMDLPDRSIKASLTRLAGDDEEASDDEEMEDKEESKKKASFDDRIARLERVLIKLAESEDPGDDDSDDDDDDDDSDDEDEGEEESKSKKASALERRVARIERVLVRLAGDDEEASDDEEAKSKSAGYYMDDDAMLADMLSEEGMVPAEMMGDDDAEMMDDGALMDEMLLEEMLNEEAAHAKMSESHDEAMGDDHAEAMGDDHEMMADPMGVMDVESDEMMVLAKLFNDRAAADEKEEEAEEKAAETIQEEVEEKAEDKEESKKASLRPQPKRASTGATRLGGVSKEAASEVNDLSKLWESAPDVSKFF